MFRTICFLLLLGSALAEEPLDVLVKSATSFSAAIGQQLQMLQRDPSPREFAQKTINYATAKTAYFEALRAAMPELIRNATGQEKSQKSDALTAAFAVAGEKQQALAEEKTKALFKRFSPSPDVEWARVEFEHAQKVEERFHKDFDGLDYGQR
jgi:hypothetical protein